MASVLAVLISGVLAGAVHVATGPDHLAALLPLSVGRRLRAFGTGARWGVGHSAGVLLVGLLAVALRHRLDLEVVGAWGEGLVGVVLIAIGTLGVRRALRVEIHAHPHAHQPGASPDHVHLHAHLSGREGHLHDHTAFAAGTMHGVAGTAHLLGVLPAVALPGWGAGVYLGSFALGTILAMGSFAALVGEGSARLSGDVPRLVQRLLLGASATTVAVGVAWLGLSLVSGHA